MKKQEDFQFALNQATIYFESNKLVVSYGEGHSAEMDLETEEERQLVKMLLDDSNLWGSFLSALSEAMEQNK